MLGSLSLSLKIKIKIKIKIVKRFYVQVISSLLLGSAVAAPQDYQSYLEQLHQYRWQMDNKDKMSKWFDTQDGVSACLT